MYLIEKCIYCQEQYLSYFYSVRGFPGHDLMSQHVSNERLLRKYCLVSGVRVRYNSEVRIQVSQYLKSQGSTGKP
jgi:hypothetical protein